MREAEGGRWVTCIEQCVFAMAGLVIASILGCDDRQPVQFSSDDIESSARAEGESSPWFEESAEARGLQFTMISGHGDRYFMPEIMGGGAALFDMDNDGDLDAYLVQCGGLMTSPGNRPGNQLFRNNGDGTFADVTAASGTDDRGYGMGVACGDYDNDGDVDLYVTNVGPNVLLRNDGLDAGGNTHFSDMTSSASVGHDGWGASAAFFDFDEDGDLDLFVTNYLRWSPQTELDCYNEMGGEDYCSPKNYAAPTHDVLYRNNGDGTFTDVSESMGFNVSVGTGLGVVPGDFTGDGKQDIIVANDGMANLFWIQRDGSFLEQGLIAGCAFDQEGIAKAGMGIACADIDDDRDLDLLIVNLARESDSLFLNDGRGMFNDSTLIAGLGAKSRTFTRFGLGLVDFDNDGILDVYEANGRVMRQSRSLAEDPYAEPDLVFKGAPGGKFEEVLPRGGTPSPLIATSRAAAFGDIDNDGGIDVLVANRDAPAHLLRNVVPNRGHWLIIRVVEEHGRDALGATVQVALNDRLITRDVRAAYSYMASNDPRVHVGLGQVTRADDISVVWLDGSVESFGPHDADQVVTLKRGQGRTARR
jgi:hypothetical protein